MTDMRKKGANEQRGEGEGREREGGKGEKEGGERKRDLED
jgi:hypothetical protein